PVVNNADAGPIAADAGRSHLGLAAVGREAEAYLFPEAATAADEEARARACPAGASRERVLCLLDLRYRTDPAALAIARELYATHGILAGLERDHSEHMGWRGMIHLVPEPPIGRYRTHLEWILASAHDFDHVFTALDPEGDHPPRYRWRPVVLR